MLSLICVHCKETIWDLSADCPHCGKVPIHITPQTDLGDEIITNPEGGQQSKIPTRCDLLDGGALLRLSGVLELGASRYAPWNWLKIDKASHLNHALNHIFRHLQGDTSDDHLGHAFCRLMMACRKEQDELD